MKDWMRLRELVRRLELYTCISMSMWIWVNFTCFGSEFCRPVAFQTPPGSSMQKIIRYLSSQDETAAVPVQGR